MNILSDLGIVYALLGAAAFIRDLTGEDSRCRDRHRGEEAGAVR